MAKRKKAVKHTVKHKVKVKSRKIKTRKMSESKSNVGLLSTILIVLLVLLGWMIYLKSQYIKKPLPQESTGTEQVTPKPTPTPTSIPLPKKKVSYRISQSDKTGPQVSAVTFDPLDVQKGKKLTITVHETFSQPIDSVKATLQMDNTTKDLVFKLISGTSVNGDWQVSFILDDTVLYKYILKITSTSGNKSSVITVAPRS